MAEQIKSDLLMKFDLSRNDPIPGEVGTQLNLRRCAMTSGFTEGFMFEVQSFTLKTGLGGEEIDEAQAKQRQEAQKQTKNINKSLQAMANKLGVKVDNLSDQSQVEFSKFLKGDDNAKYPVDMKPMEFTRSIDKSSVLLLQHCINRRVFDTVSLIKRKAAGGPVSGEVFLRFDFKQVLIKSIDWDDGEPIKETCEFVCRSVIINYLPQLPDGTLGAPINTWWSAMKDFVPENLGS